MGRGPMAERPVCRRFSEQHGRRAACHISQAGVVTHVDLSPHNGSVVEVKMADPACPDRLFSVGKHI
jgi:hypothetical protein